ncbi:MAG: polyprenyl synthetase family protein [Dehalococcoidia bacterium]
MSQTASDAVMSAYARSSIALPAFFSRYQGDIEAALRAELAPRSLSLYDTHRYYLGWTGINGEQAESGGGKAMRPTLCLLACDAAGGDINRAMPVAVALELVHNFSLIHDDLEDGDRFRRHRPTVWAIWGEATAVVSGNAMLKIADLATQRLRECGVPPGVALEAEHVLTENYLRMMEGQYLDIAFESRDDVTVKEYLDMIERKTGALIEVSVYLGSLVARTGEPDRALAEGLRRVGYELGRVFQIRDDVLGVWGGPATGKPVGADIQRKKKALPAVHALTHTTGAAEKELRLIYAKETPDADDVERVLEIMDKAGTQKYCQHLAEERWHKGQSVLKSLSLAGVTGQEFDQLGEFLLVRES